MISYMIKGKPSNLFGELMDSHIYTSEGTVVMDLINGETIYKVGRTKEVDDFRGIHILDEYGYVFMQQFNHFNYGTPISLLYCINKANEIDGDVQEFHTLDEVSAKVGDKLIINNGIYGKMTYRELWKRLGV